MIINSVLVLLFNYFFVKYLDVTRIKQKSLRMTLLLIMMVLSNSVLVIFFTDKIDVSLLMIAEVIVFGILAPVYLFYLDKNKILKMLWRYRERRIAFFFSFPFVSLLLYSGLFHAFHFYLITGNEPKTLSILVSFYLSMLLSTLMWYPFILNLMPIIPDWSYIKKILMLCLYSSIRVFSFVPILLNGGSAKIQFIAAIYFGVDLLITTIALFFVIKNACNQEDQVDKRNYWYSDA